MPFCGNSALRNYLTGVNLQNHRGLPEVHRATAHFEPITLKFVGQTMEEKMKEIKKVLLRVRALLHRRAPVRSNL
jgi:2'-5' RNA ligase